MFVFQIDDVENNNRTIMGQSGTISLTYNTHTFDSVCSCSGVKQSLISGSDFALQSYLKKAIEWSFYL